MRLPYNAGLIVFVLGSLGRRWFIAKFAVSNFATGIGDVATGPQGDCAEQNYSDHEWRR